MPTTNTLRKTLDRKQWEQLNPPPFTPASGFSVVGSSFLDQYQFAMTSASVFFLYDPAEDAWQELPTPGVITGTFGPGSCACFHPNGPTGTATAGTATTITVPLANPRSLAGYTIRITGGTGAGQERVITSNTKGAVNSVLTVPTWTVNPDATSTFLLITGRFYAFVGGASGPNMRFFDLATFTWSAALTMTTPPTTPGTDARMRPTPGWATGSVGFANGTSTGTNTTTTLNNTGKAWTVNQWTNFQVRITAGTGAGQVRTVSSNTATALTVSAVWSVTPDATSVYSIEGNDDHIYWIGNNAVTLFRYSISTGTWTTLAPGAARVAAPTTGISLHWIHNVISDSTWATENAIINGRRFYSFRGGAGSVLDYYDISANTWVSGVPYTGSVAGGPTFTTGSSFDHLGNGIIMVQKDAVGRFFRLDIPNNSMLPWNTLFYPQGAAIIGSRSFAVNYTDGGTVLTFVYYISNSQALGWRSLII